jgi:hypothetical protein
MNSDGSTACILALVCKKMSFLSHLQTKCLEENRRMKTAATFRSLENKPKRLRSLWGVLKLSLDQVTKSHLCLRLMALCWPPANPSMPRRSQQMTVGRTGILVLFLVIFFLLYSIFSQEKLPPEPTLRRPEEDLSGWYQENRWNISFQESFCPAYVEETYLGHAPKMASVSPWSAAAKVLHSCKQRFDVGVVSFDNIPGESYDDTVMYFWLGILRAPTLAGKVTWGCTTFHWLGQSFEAMRSFNNILIAGGRWQLSGRPLPLFSYLSNQQRVAFLLKGSEGCTPPCGPIQGCTYDPARLARVGDPTYVFGFHVYQDCLLLDRRRFFQFPLGPSTFTGFPSSVEGVEEMIGGVLPTATNREHLLFAMVSGPFQKKYGRAQALRVAKELCKKHSCHVQSVRTRALFFTSKALEYLQPSRSEQVCVCVCVYIYI